MCLRSPTSDAAGLGGYGVAVGNASVDVTVEGSLFDSLGQGGVVMLGYDGSAPIPAGGGSASGYNCKPHRVRVSHNVFHNLGQTLVHVAGVSLRAAAECTIDHNRISRTPRYGISVDSFFPGTADQVTQFAQALQPGPRLAPRLGPRLGPRLAPCWLPLASRRPLSRARV